MKRGMSGMPAVVKERFRRLVFLAMYILMFAGMVFAEMSALARRELEP
jgi:hypothetical protein